jgi:excisionase family DNA binding protein
VSDLPKLLYNLDEVAAILDCKKTTVYHLLTDKKIIAKKLGKRTLVPADSLHAFIADLPDADIQLAPPIGNRFEKRQRERLDEVSAK